MMTLQERYKKNTYRKFANGDDLLSPAGEQPAKDYGKFSSAMAFGTQIASGILDATAKPDPVSGRLSTGTVVGKSMLSGASAGASFGPIGAGIGAVLGAGAGLFTSGKEKKEARRMLAERNMVQQSEDSSRSAALLASNPNLVTGYRNAGYFAVGGTLPGGDDPKPGLQTRQLNQEELNQWNQFLDFVKEKGYEGSEKLNDRNKSLGETLFNEFRKSNKNITIGYDIVPSVQSEMVKIRDKARDFAKRHNQPDYEKIMEGISAVDGWFGSKTSQYRFPSFTYNEIKNGSLVKSENLGLVDGSMTPFGKKVPTTVTGKKIPDGVKIEKLENGYFYEDPQSGDLVQVKMENGGNLAAAFRNMTGGTIRKLASDSAEFSGRSHEDGGIKLHDINAEVEDKESIKGSYVFSDKLGFASAHKKLARAKGIIEKKPVTRERINSMRLLNDKENQLIIAQELVKNQLQIN